MEDQMICDQNEIHTALIVIYYCACLDDLTNNFTMDLVSEIATDDWQANRETIRERNKYMFQNTLMSDVSFVVRADSSCEGKTLEVPAHKYVLAVSSPVFFAMFYGGMAEVGEKIELPDCESESFLEFLRYLYCDELNVSARNVLGVMYLAKKYIVPSLTRKCGLFLEERIEPGNVFDTLKQAKHFGESNLESRCWFIIDLNATQCLQSKSFLNLDQQTVFELLKREELKVDESVLFDAIVRWATEKCQNENLELSGANMRRQIADAITSIRFPAMSQSEFAENVVPRGILSDRESLNVFLYLSAIAKKPKLPFPCSPRKGRQLQRCCRSPDPPTPLHWYRPPGTGNSVVGNVGRREENVSFVLTTSTLVYIAGVRLFTHTNFTETKPDCIKLWLYEEDREMAKIEGEYLTTAGGFFSGPGVDVFLDHVVPAQNGRRYGFRAVILYSHAITSNRHTTVKEVTTDTVKFSFDSCFSGSHFIEFLYYIP